MLRSSSTTYLCAMICLNSSSRAFRLDVVLLQMADMANQKTGFSLRSWDGLQTCQSKAGGVFDLDIIRGSGRDLIERE